MPTHLEDPSVDDDQLPLPHFEDQLWAELAELQASVRGRSGRRGWWDRRTLVLPAVAAAAAVAVVAGTVALIRDDGGPSVEIGPAGTTTQPQSPTTDTWPAGSTTTDTVPFGQTPGTEPADETAHLPGGQPDQPPIEATVVPEDAIVYVEQYNVDGSFDQRWADETTGRMRNLQVSSDGEPLLDSAWLDITHNDDGSVSIAQRTVDYSHSTYRDWAWAPPAPAGTMRTDWREDFVIRSGITNGRYIADGTEVVDGRELLVYVDALYGQADPDSGRTWVEPGSYRPIKRLGYPGSNVEYTQITQYLPRTPENLALLEPPIPAGFTPE